MAKLIDSYLDNRVEFKGRWYIAKPLSIFSLKDRVKDSLGVLFGKYTAVRFVEDALERYKKENK